MDPHSHGYDGVSITRLQNGRGESVDALSGPPIQIKPEPDADFVPSNVAIQAELEDDYPGIMQSSPSSSPTKPKRPRTTKPKVTVKQEPGGLPGSGPGMFPGYEMVDGVPIKQEMVHGVPVKQEKITGMLKEKKKRDRFKGMTEEEVLQRVLPDHLAPGLDIVIIGINPGLTAAFVGHHYAGPGNHFWKCLFLSGLIPTQMNAYDDFKLLDHGIGFTNIVERTSRGSADLTRKEIKEGGEILLGKIQTYKPKIAVFNGKGIYEIFCGKKKFPFGKQEDPFPGCDDTLVYVMPSSSARCTQLPRAVDKVPFYAALKKLRDHLRGELDDLDMGEVSFPDVFLKTAERKDKGIKEEPGVKKEPGSPAKAKVAEGAEKPKRKRRSKKEMDELRAAQAGAREAAQGGGAASNLALHASGPASVGMISVNGGMPSLPGLTTASDRYQQSPGLPPPSSQSAMSIEPQSTTSQPNSATPASDPTLATLFCNPHELVKQEDTTELAQYGVLGALPFMHPQPGGAYPGVPFLPAPAHIPITCAPSWDLHSMQNVPLTSQHHLPPHLLPSVTAYPPYPTPHWQPPHSAPLPHYNHPPPHLNMTHPTAPVSNVPTEHVITNTSHW